MDEIKLTFKDCKLERPGRTQEVLILFDTHRTVQPRFIIESGWFTTYEYKRHYWLKSLVPKIYFAGNWTPIKWIIWPKVDIELKKEI